MPVAEWLSSRLVAHGRPDRTGDRDMVQNDRADQYDVVEFPAILTL